MILNDLQPVIRRYECQVLKVLETLDKADKTVLENALIDPAWSNQGLAKALQERGLLLSKHQIMSHRNRLCWCNRA